MISFDQPWQPQLDWSAPAGRVLDRLVDALPANRKWEIIVFGSSPLQLGVDSGFLSGIVDVFRPSFDEESAGNPAHNTQILWRELFGKNIDVRSQIIAPALTERSSAYGEAANGLKARLPGIKPSK